MSNMIFYHGRVTYLTTLNLVLLFKILLKKVVK